VSADEIVQFLCRLFPSFRAMPPAEAAAKTEGLGLYAARVWVAGPDGLAGRGIPVPPEVHAPLAPIAPRVAEARQGGAKFLAHLRSGFSDDQRFAQALTGLAKVYAESLRGAPQPASAPAAPKSSDAGPATAKSSDAGPATAKSSDAGPAAAKSSDAGPAKPSAPAGEAASGGDLDLALEEPSPDRSFDLPLGFADEGEPGAAPARPAPNPAPPPGPVSPPAAGRGDLDLLPDEEAEEPGRPSVEELLYGGSGAAAAAPAAGEAAKEKPAAEAPGHLPAPVDDEDDGWGQAPKDPAERAIFYFERTGDPAGLDEAEKVLGQQLQAAPHATIAAFAEAGLARAALLRGDGEGASERARSAQGRDPGNPAAAEVLIAVERGEADRAPLAARVAALGSALAEGDFGTGAARAAELRSSHPDEPLAFLAEAYMAHARGERERFEAAVREAWRRFPSAAHPGLTFGGGLDADVADALVHYGRQPFKQNDPDRLRQTVEDIDSKDNVLAGALRLAVGLARAALVRPGQPKARQRRLHFALGGGLVGLQYYDAAVEAFGKVVSLAPQPHEVKAVSDERIEAGALRRAFDRPGIKAQLKAYRCPVFDALRQQLQGRLEDSAKAREAKKSDTTAQGAKLADMAKQDPSIRKEIEEASVEHGMVNPFEALQVVEEEIEDIQAERSKLKEGPKKPAKAEGGGLFGRIKAAAGAAVDGVSGAARDAQLKLKESQASGRRQQAVAKLALVLAREWGDHEFQSPALLAFARQNKAIEALVEAYEAEEARLQAAMKRLAATQ